MVVDRVRGRGCGLVLLAVLLAGGPATAQIPDEFTNLKVLPPDISRRELQGTMRGFSGALGVQCIYCHVGEPGQPLSTFDFASDDKVSKRKARDMIRMVSAINDTHLAAIEAPLEPAVQVTCVTCHRGVAEPRMLDDILAATVEAEGAEAAVAKYRGLRERYFGSYTYDFSDRMLIGLSMRLGREGRSEAGLALARLTLEFYPASAAAHFSVGELLRGAEQNDEALRHYRRTLELDPDHRAAQRRVRELTGN